MAKPPHPPLGVKLPPRHLALVIAVVAVWGTNFVVIHEGLKYFPPLFFATLRFALSAVPAMLLFGRPNVPWRYIAGYGLLTGAGQFGLLYIAMDGHIAPGLASLVIQLQVPFTIILSALIFGERLHGRQVLSFAICAAGLVAVALGNGGTATLVGLLLVTCAALSWALANIVVKRMGTAPMVPFVVWASGAAVPPLLGLSLIVDGPQLMLHSLHSAGWWAWSTVVWQAAANTLFGFAAWSWLLSRYPAGIVTPAAVLVPVFGLGSAALVLGEPMPLLKSLGAALIIGGVTIELLIGRRRKAPSAEAE